MLDAAVRNSGLEGILEPHLTTDRVNAFKPDPRAYQMGIDAFGLRREEITFAAFGGWDVGRRQDLWLHYLLGQPGKNPGRRAGRRSRLDRYPAWAKWPISSCPAESRNDTSSKALIIITKNSDGLMPGSGSWESISALPAPSEPYVQVSPHTAQASASIIEVPRGGRPGRHHRWTRIGEVVAVAGSRRLSVMIPRSSSASSSKIDRQTPQRPSCCFSSRTRLTRAVVYAR